jgi:hypothetical protein
MQCPKCNSEDFEHPAVRSALEIFKCLSCGEEIAVHCHYLIPDEFRSKHEVFRGRYLVVDDNATKDFIKLKNMLRGCQWFQLSKLEDQRLDKANVWDLGIFLDIEAAQIKVACQQNSIEIIFELADDD